jgi:hypothetical protein
VNRKCVYLAKMYSFFTNLSYKRLLLVAFVTTSSHTIQAQPEVMALEQLGALTPEKIEGYKTIEQNKGRSLKIGTLSYAMIERTFIHDKKQITIMLFDYNNASVMYRQATQKWENAVGQETDLLLENAYEVEQQPGWIWYDKAQKKSQITLGIQNRFYLVLIGQGILLTDLESVAKIFDFVRFPPASLNIMNPKFR